jgi:hypothetical protein
VARFVQVAARRLRKALGGRMVRIMSFQTARPAGAAAGAGGRTNFGLGLPRTA